MALPQSGNTISLLDMAIEFGDTPDYKLDDFYRGGALVNNREENQNVPLANTISLENFFGSSAGSATRPLIKLSVNSGTVANNVDLLTWLNNTPGFFNGNSDIFLTVQAGANIASNVANANDLKQYDYSLYIPSGINPGNKVTLVNKGIISGQGGNGGSGGFGYNYGLPGGSGTHGVFVGRPINYVNLSYIQGGSGGGGGGQGGSYIAPSPPKGGGGYTQYLTGGTGGGGSGFPQGTGGYPVVPADSYPSIFFYQDGRAGGYYPGAITYAGSPGGYSYKGGTGQGKPDYGLVTGSNGAIQFGAANGGFYGLPIVVVNESDGTPNSVINVIYNTDKSWNTEPVPLTAAAVYKDANLKFYNANTSNPTLDFGNGFLDTYDYYFQGQSDLYINLFGGGNNAIQTNLLNPTSNTATSWYNNLSNTSWNISNRQSAFPLDNLIAGSFSVSANINFANTDFAIDSNTGQYPLKVYVMGDRFSEDANNDSFYKVANTQSRFFPLDSTSGKGLYVRIPYLFGYGTGIFGGDVLNMKYELTLRQRGIYDSNDQKINGSIFLQRNSKVRYNKSNSFTSTQHANTAQTLTWVVHANGRIDLPANSMSGTANGAPTSWLYNPNNDFLDGANAYVAYTNTGTNDANAVMIQMRYANSGSPILQSTLGNRISMNLTNSVVITTTANNVTSGTYGAIGSLVVVYKPGGPNTAFSYFNNYVYKQ